MRTVVATLLLLVSCTSSSGKRGAEISASCVPSGSMISIKAQRGIFDTRCIAAPANQAFTIVFDNRDPGEPHNVAILSDDPSAKPEGTVLFRGEEFSGPKRVTYRVGALAAGRYFFRCDLHPRVMTGAFLVE